MINLDEKAFEAARKALGTRTKVETVNAALQHVGERGERVRAINEIVDAMPSYEDYLKEKTDRSGR